MLNFEHNTDLRETGQWSPETTRLVRNRIFFGIDEVATKGTQCPSSAAAAKMYSSPHKVHVTP